MPPKNGLRIPRRREVLQETELRSATAATTVMRRPLQVGPSIGQCQIRQIEPVPISSTANRGIKTALITDYARYYCESSFNFR